MDVGLILSKMKLNLAEVEGHILSPGNIFWKKKSENLVLVAAKSDFLNLELIRKLSDANHELFIEKQIDLELQEEFYRLFAQHKHELLITDKAQWRKSLRSFFTKRMCSDEISQLELNQLTWKVFSNVGREKAKQFLDQDIQLFNRAMSITTSYTLCAFMLGYYSDAFLSQLFNETFLSLVEIDREMPICSLKAKLEKIRTADSWQDEEKTLLSSVYHLTKKQNCLLGERFDGSGVLQVKKIEMTDLEIVMVALNEHYAYVETVEKNIFYEIKNSSFKCDQRILRVLQKFLRQEDEQGITSEMSA